jgi:hypothetical protein
MAKPKDTAGRITIPPQNPSESTDGRVVIPPQTASLETKRGRVVIPPQTNVATPAPKPGTRARPQGTSRRK